ncbi:hypothetical protein NDU88_004367 [Pleurodeles waltl]|uniref:Uncharacterized protein n=1 Tax=Pleurodeles waltl TaxID=8319 RepID=A0AAV7QFY4_PLEWA|nr:hypothetical protein NDU88_004367 [Pleurodeles waltl]
MRRGPRLVSQRSLAAPDRSPRGRTRFRLLRENRALRPPIRLLRSPAGGHVILPSGGTAPYSVPPSPPRRQLRSHTAPPPAEARRRPNSAGASPTGGIPMPLGACDRSAAPILSVSPCRGSGPD